jgi:hypothetical protein
MAAQRTVDENQSAHVMMSFRCTKEQADQIEQLSKLWGVSRSSTFRMMLAQTVAREVVQEGDPF